MPRPRACVERTSKGPSQHPAGAGHVTHSHIIPDRRAGNLQAARPDRRMHVTAKARTPRQVASVRPRRPRRDGRSGSYRPHGGCKGPVRPPECRAQTPAPGARPALHQRAAPPPRQCRVRDSRRRRSLMGVSRRGAWAGRRNCSGWGSKVMATARSPCSCASRRHRRKNCWWPRCTPSKVADGGYARAKARRNLRNRLKDRNQMALGHQCSVPRFTGRLRPS